ncbi:nickel-dependent hydrogenase large subunit [Streptomyces sp. NPDC047315]|uniref:Ni/Fe hydrogenase subunit alpha n=1 Tax=Streptomyces sp. NPDC047315 TaxID=3155142 RepID=UPI0033E6F5FF
MTGERYRELSVGALARVEGQAAASLAIEADTVTAARLRIYEPPRFFEAFLRGRSHTEPPDLTARICGICPVAYQLSACRAIEDARGVVVDDRIAALRRLLYCGEWIESHTLHVYMLHAPDFLGHHDVLDLARTHRAHVERGLRLKRAGNLIVEVLGGRAVHPVNVRIGGFHRTPARSELRPLTQSLERAREDAVETVRWVAGFDFPDAHCDADLLALARPDTYAIESGTPTVLRQGRSGEHRNTFPLEAFTERVRETQVRHSTALHATLDGRRHLTGALARYSISSRLLPSTVRDLARSAGLDDVCRNPYRSIVVRAIEVLYAVEEARRLIDSYEPPPRPAEEVPPGSGTGHGATEAPRGLLYHRYALDRQGIVEDAVIVPPTAQNQGAIEEDLRQHAQRLLGRGKAVTDEELTRLCERVVRNHDPCISCATHFLDLDVERS